MKLIKLKSILVLSVLSIFLSNSVSAGNLMLNTTTGNVGIGTTTPLYKLDVTGDINSTGSYRIDGVDIIDLNKNWTGSIISSLKGGTGLSSCVDGQILKWSGSYWSCGADQTGLNIGGSNGQIQFNNNGSLGADSYFFWDNTNNRFGVGTATPGSVLEIKTSASTDTNLLKIGDNNKSAYITAGTSYFGIATNDGVNRFKIDQTTGNATFANTVTAPTFIGSLSGNATTATNATNAANATNANYATTAGSATTATTATSASTATYATTAGTANTVAWVNVTGKPATAVESDPTVPAWAKVATLPTWNQNTTGNAGSVGDLVIHLGRNNEANKIVRTDANGYLQTGYINSSSGDEANNASPARVWGTNGTDSYLRTYLASALSVKYAVTAGSAVNAVAKQDGARYTTDYNTILNSGFYNGEGTPANSPNAYGQLIVAKGVDTGLQIAGGYNIDNLFFRGWWSSGTGFGPWRTIIHSGNIASQSVNYAASAGAVAWENINGKPNTSANNFQWNWSGVGGTPTWLWGGSDGTNMYVYNPANFSVNYANSAGTLTGVTNSGPNPGVGANGYYYHLGSWGTSFASAAVLVERARTADNVLAGGNGVPAGAIMSFYLSACPAGWILANGANGTPDLQGVFVRGTGTPVGYYDTSGSHGLGTKQEDAFQGHAHTMNVNVAGNPDGWGDYGRNYWNNNWASSGPASSDPVIGSYGAVRPATETRPKNVALLYCMKQ